MDSSKAAILKTLIYADFFDYPLTKDEIYHFLISKDYISYEEISGSLKEKKLPIETNGKYYYLKGRETLVKKRKLREKISKQKLELAKKIINKISIIPSIKFIGISGALAMNNCDKDDDIDLFVITEKTLAWVTRLLTIFVLKTHGVYRNRNSKSHIDKICLNMIIDENHLHFMGGNQNLYTAHEITQVLPVFDKEKTYDKFIKSNLWIKKYLHNFLNTFKIEEHKNNFVNNFIIGIFNKFKFETIAKFLQLIYMNKHKTTEITENGFLKFHPFDYKHYILSAYKKTLEKYFL
jgi:hypothetical protein